MRARGKSNHVNLNHPVGRSQEEPRRKTKVDSRVRAPEAQEYGLGAQHPGHLIAKKQTTGFSGMISFRINGGINEATIFLKACQVFTLGESLGAVESLCEHP